ncbi:MAG: hypothetical protein BWX64_00928 [Acidobacteria bacterium ADurb.Bin051]|nr:MAG: hypothetical protein BWX64_00928 [Acidobacteria bacterium ADurb.Bin051]
MADERQVKATLEVQRTGDQAAFAKTAEEIERVGSAADGAAPKLQEFGDSAEQASRKVLAHGESFAASADKGNVFSKTIREATSSLDGMINAAGRIAGVVGSMWAAWEVGYSVGTKIRQAFNWLTDGEFDTALQSFIQDLSGLGDGANTVAEEVERLTNIVNILQKNGFDTLKMSAAELEAAYEGLIAKKREAAFETENLQAAYEKWIEKTGLSEEALAKASKELEFFAAELKKTNEGMSDTDVAVALGRQIDSLVDKYQMLGVAAPASILRLQEAWEEASEKTEKAAKKTKSAAEEQQEAIAKMADEIVEKIQPMGESLGDLAAAWEQALGKIDWERLSGEGLEKAREMVQQLVEEYRAAGTDIPPALEKAADATGVFLAGIERTIDKGHAFSGAVDDMAGAALQMTQEVDAAGNVITRISEAAGEAAGSLEEAGAALTGSGEAASGASSAMEQVQAEWRALKEAAGDAGSAVEEAGGQIAAGSQEAGSGAGEIQKAADAGKSAGEGMSTAATAATSLAEAMSSASASATSIADVLATIQGPSEAAAQAMGQIKAAAEGLSGVSLAGLVAQLQAVAEAAQAAAAALDQVEGVEGGT